MCARARSTRRCVLAADGARRAAALAPTHPRARSLAAGVRRAQGERVDGRRDTKGGRRFGTVANERERPAAPAAFLATPSLDRVPRLSLRRAQRNKSPNFKYMVSCLVLQKRGAGLHSASLATWDAQTDGACTVQWCVALSLSRRRTRGGVS